MKNYTKTNVGTAARTELHDALSLTGAEVSINQLPAGAGVPFVHSHKHNEEIYGVISGSGKAVIDGETVALTAGDWLRVAPAAKRQFSADAESGITFVCIQVKENSLDGFTADDVARLRLESRDVRVYVSLLRAAERQPRCAQVVRKLPQF